MTQTSQRLPPTTRGPLSKPPHSSTSRHHVTLIPLVSPLCPRPSTLAASSCWAMPPVRVRLDPRCLSPRAHRHSTRAHRLFQWTLRTTFLCSFLALPRPTSGRNVTSGRRPTLLAARLALHTTLVKQPLASPSWSINRSCGPRVRAPRFLHVTCATTARRVRARSAPSCPPGGWAVRPPECHPIHSVQCQARDHRTIPSH